MRPTPNTVAYAALRRELIARAAEIVLESGGTEIADAAAAVDEAAGGDDRTKAYLEALPRKERLILDRVVHFRAKLLRGTL